MSVATTKPLNIIRDVRAYLRFRTPAGRSSCRGVYNCRKAAEDACPRGARHGFDHPEMVQMYHRDYAGWNHSDYPVVFWLSRVAAPNVRLLDLGGSIGMAYYNYGKLFPIPDSMRWTVCDVPAAVEYGRQLASERGAFNLHFESECDLSACDVLLSCGALAYLPNRLVELLSVTSNPPRHLVVNRMPLTAEETFYTVQNQGESYAAYRIESEKRLFADLEDLGYRRVDSWSLARTCTIPFQRLSKPVTYQGFYFAKSEGAS